MRLRSCLIWSYWNIKETIFCYMYVCIYINISKISANNTAAEMDVCLWHCRACCANSLKRNLCFHRQQSRGDTMDQTHPDLLLCLWGKQLPAALHKYWKKNSLGKRPDQHELRITAGCCKEPSSCSSVIKVPWESATCTATFAFSVT